VTPIAAADRGIAPFDSGKVVVKTVSKIVTNGAGCDIHHQRSVTRSTRAVTQPARGLPASLCERARYPIL